jgi:branched-chain amino acid transport system ATP-binding protein
LIKLNNLDVFYGEVHVLKNVNLKVEKGEIVTLIGSNGAGKTTTLKTIIGLLKPKSGNIDFLGDKIHLIPAHEVIKKGISLVPEGRDIFPNMTVIENLLLGAYLCKDKEKINKELEYVFELFPVLKERQKQVAGTFSGGEQQMLSIGRGLMSQPKLLMLDEPSLGIAPKIVENIFEIIKEINKKGVTILLVEQNVRIALTMANRVYVMENGKIIMEGEAQKLLNDEKIREAYLGM